MRRFLLAFDRVVGAGGGLCVGLLLLLPVLITADVGMRSLRMGALPWVIDASEYILYVATLAGAPWALQQGAHVSIDALTSVLPERVSRAIDRGVHLTGAAVCLLLAWWGGVGTAEAISARTMIYKAITLPEWPFRAVFTLCMTLLAIELARRITNGSAEGLGRLEGA
jgi:C4-dicarboxylate transporter DctQ subunit